MSSILTGCNQEIAVLLKSLDAPIAIFAGCGSPLKWLPVMSDNTASEYWWKFNDRCPGLFKSAQPSLESESRADQWQGARLVRKNIERTGSSSYRPMIQTRSTAASVR